MPLDEAFLRALTIRSMQALGGLTVYRYFLDRARLSEELCALARHQVSVLIEEDLPRWDSRGACLPINGRGDPTPSAFRQTHQDLLGVPGRLVDAATEIGLSALYTSDHRDAIGFLLTALDLAGSSRQHILDARLAPLLPQGTGWGPTISDVAYAGVIAHLSDPC